MDSVDLVVNAETSFHPKRPANNGVKGEVGSIVATFDHGSLSELAT